MSSIMKEYISLMKMVEDTVDVVHRLQTISKSTLASVP